MDRDQMLLLWLAVCGLLWLLVRRRQPRRGNLDAALFHWTKHDPFTVRDLVNGGVCIVGRVGSGKTSSSGRVLAQAIVNYRNSGGLICAAKPGEDVRLWQKIFAQAGRSRDLLIFEPEGKLRFNFLAEALRRGGHTREITHCITTIGETLRSANTNRGENADFWQREQERMIYNSVGPVKLATGAVNAPDLQEFIVTAAEHPAQIHEPAWKNKFHCQSMQAAFEARKSKFDAHDFQLACDYWLSEVPAMSDRTRSSIMTGVLGILHTFNTGLVRELVSTTSNVGPDDMLRRK